MIDLLAAMPRGATGIPPDAALTITTLSPAAAALALAPLASAAPR
jgi:hypothetical protein